MLDAAASSISDHTAGLELNGMRSVLDAFQGRTVRAAEAAAGVLADPRCSPAAAHLAGWGLATACGGLGRLDGVDEALQRIDARVESFEIGLHQAAVVVALWQRGLLLAGLLDQAEHTTQRYRERCQDTPGPGEVMTSYMCAEVANSRGQVQTAARLCRQAIAGIQGVDPAGWSLRGFVSLTGARDGRGRRLGTPSLHGDHRRPASRFRLRGTGRAAGRGLGGGRRGRCQRGRHPSSASG
ncbi:MAG TPA: hypothetical protein VIY28_01560 [Pseudonocardiaceae bacterium]